MAHNSTNSKIPRMNPIKKSKVNFSEPSLNMNATIQQILAMNIKRKQVSFSQKAKILNFNKEDDPSQIRKLIAHHLEDTYRTLVFKSDIKQEDKKAGKGILKKKRALVSPNYDFGWLTSDDDNRPERIDENLSLDSVGGLTEQVAYIKDKVISALKEQNTLRELWGQEPERGIIFYGPPGTGKSFMAKALAAELSKETNDSTKITFFMCRGTDLLNKFVGETERNIRGLFKKAKAMKPSIIFFDELDGLCPSRTDAQHQIYTNVVTTLLGEIDAVQRGDVFLIGATNRLSSLDPAIRRPGRFGKQLAFYPPNEAGRLEILNIYLKKWRNRPCQQELAFIAKQTTGYTGAELSQVTRNAFNICRHKSSILTREGLKNLKVTWADWSTGIFLVRDKMKIPYWDSLFSHAMFTGQDLSREMEPLLGGIRNEIQLCLRNLYPDSCSTTKKELGLKILHVWKERDTDVKILNDHILPAILASVDPDEIPTFYLSVQTMASFVHPATQIKNFFEQIQSCFKTTVILFLPSIDLIWSSMDTITRTTFAESLETIRNKRSIILSTGTADLNEACYALKFIDPDSSTQIQVKLRQPNRKEICSFFSQLFDPRAKQFGDCTSRRDEEDLRSLLDESVDLCQNKPLDKMFSLQGTFQLLINKAYKPRLSSKEVNCLILKLKQGLSEFKLNNN